MRCRQDFQEAEAVLSDLAGVSFPFCLALRQPCVLDPAAIALVPSRGGQGMQPVRSNGRGRVEGRSQRLGDKLQPIEGANGCQHMRGVGPLPPPGLEDAALGSGKNLGRYAASWIACWPRPRRPSSTAALTWSTRCAPRGDQRICLRLFMRALTRWLTVPSAREVEIGLPAR